MPSWSSDLAAEPPHTITPRDIEERWADISFFDKPPLAEALSGVPVEYRILEVYSRDAGQRAAELKFDVGQGTADLAFRSDIPVVFTAAPARRIGVRVEDERGRPSIARLIVRDGASRVYPAMSKRLAPDLPFQAQVYRSDGEGIVLPDGKYTVEWSGGPDYLTGTREITIGPGQPDEFAVRLERWIDPAARHWYSGDHHVHAAGCSHYQDPTQGVGPDDIVRQVLGERLNIGSILTWGPCYYHQKQFFSGKDDERSTADMKLRYDLEVSGFPSSHAGHLVLLGLKEQDYPGTKRIEDWPTWTSPILQWAHRQGAVTGYAHSGWGLQIADRTLPSDEVPAFDGIGANEFIVTVTAAGHGRFHLERRHAVAVGAQHLVSRAQRRLPHAHQRRDRLPLHLRRPRRPGPHLREARRADVRQLARRHPRRPELRVRRAQPPDGLCGRTASPSADPM